MNLEHALALTLSLTSLATAAALAGPPADFWSTPAIAGHGPVHLWPEASLRPDASATHKALFDVTKGDGASTEVNPGLAKVARAVNAFVVAGVPVEHLDIDVIVHGPAAPIVLGAAAYAERFGHDNPNLALLEQLTKAGVDVYVCGNTLGDRGYTPALLDPRVQVAVSAVTTSILRQNAGYALIPL
ncbi:MAG: sulfur reduction protein DsrE [Deltaproteobacteria bacterium]|nr:MAG: sulfur reduction protein DsrE [Deltaproteobacteria bacterium]